MAEWSKVESLLVWMLQCIDYSSLFPARAKIFQQMERLSHLPLSSTATLSLSKR